MALARNPLIRGPLSDDYARGISFPRSFNSRWKKSNRRACEETPTFKPCELAAMSSGPTADPNVASLIRRLGWLQPERTKIRGKGPPVRTFRVHWRPCSLEIADRLQRKAWKSDHTNLFSLLLLRVDRVPRANAYGATSPVRFPIRGPRGTAEKNWGRHVISPRSRSR